MKNISQPHKGFTLREVVIVFTIIAVITVIFIVSGSKSREAGRDANRTVQLQEVLKATELYFSNNGFYPDDGLAGIGRSPAPLSVVGPALIPAGHLPEIPEDPRYDSSEGYLYCSSDDGKSMAILANVEDDSGTDYCAVGRGPLQNSNDLCLGLASLDRCTDAL